MTPPKISIIINCKNGGSFLEDAFKALDKQDFTDFEVIFYDSESSDNSIEIFKKFRVAPKKDREAIFFGIAMRPRRVLRIGEKKRNDFVEKLVRK